MWSVAVLVAVIVLLKLSPTAREVVGESALTIFQIVTAPLSSRRHSRFWVFSS